MSMDMELDNINLGADCNVCIHNKPCGLLSTILQAVSMTATKNSVIRGEQSGTPLPMLNEVGIGFVNTYAQICEHFQIKLEIA